MIDNSSGCARIAAELAALMQKKATGKLRIASLDCARSSQKTQLDRSPNDARTASPQTETANQQQQWQFYLVKGRLLYVTESTQRVRRWSRAVVQHCPEFVVDPQQVSDREPWESQLLQIALEQSLVGINTAKSVIRSSAFEVFFNLANLQEWTSHWHPLASEFLDVSLTLALSFQDVGQIVHKAAELWQQWKEMGLSYIHPDLSPVLSNPTRLQKQVSSASFLTLNTLFNGEKTIWDLAIERKQSPLGVTRTLHHFVQQGKINLQSVPDLPSPIEQWRMVRSAVAPSQKPKTKKFKIACIDDSPLVGAALEQILKPAGYEVIKIHDPMQGVAILAQDPPDFIFLDLVMPHTNGYNLCNFLRQSSMFRDTPIAILTSQDGIIDRTRAKLNGATDFLSKPPDRQKVLQMVEKYLNPSSQPEFYPSIGYPAMA